MIVQINAACRGEKEATITTPWSLKPKDTVEPHEPQPRSVGQEFPTLWRVLPTECSRSWFRPEVVFEAF